MISCFEIVMIGGLQLPPFVLRRWRGGVLFIPMRKEVI